MSLGAVIARAVSLRSLRKDPKKPKAKDKINESITTAADTADRENEVQLAVGEPHNTPHVVPSHSSIETLTYKASEVLDTATSNRRKSQQQRQHQQQQQQQQQQQRCQRPRKNTDTTEFPFSCQIVEQIRYKLNELEYTLFEDQQQEFKLRMALERQTERVHDLRFSLDAEKRRNQRLVQLIHTTEKVCEPLSGEDETQPTGLDAKWQPMIESISPLLLQQRFDELASAYQQSRRQLARKDKLLTLVKCEKEEIQAKYEHLFDEYRNEQKRVEDICGKYLTLQFMKKQEILNLRQTLDYASDCIVSAQNLMNSCEHIDPRHDKDFNQNLRCFIKALRHCSYKRSLKQ